MSANITEVHVRAADVPLEHPVKTAVGIVGTAPLVLIDVHTDAGIVGSAYLFAYIPPALKPLASATRELGELIIGKVLAPVAIDDLIERRLRLIGNIGLLRMASAGLDMALWDALAKTQELPLAKLLGGELKSIQTYDSHAMDGRELAINRAVKAAEAGFRAVKTKIGYPTLDEDLEVIRGIRQATDGRVAIMVDYNQSLGVAEAIRRGRILDGEGLAWIEEPTLQQDYLGHARIRSELATPIQMGENWFGPDEMSKCLAAQATSYGMADIMKIGGVTGWMRASALAQTNSIPLSSHLFQEFSAHLLAVTPTAHWLERLDIAGPIIEPLLTFKGGEAQLPDVPGAGVVWRDREVEKYLI